jgi:hypothetical protein
MLKLNLTLVRFKNFSLLLVGQEPKPELPELEMH